MSYEFNPDSQAFEFPNPYKIENLALIASGIFMTVAGIGTMIGVRDRIAQGLDGTVLAVIAIAVFLLFFAIGLLARAFTQLRYFFGRNRPDSLARLLPTDQDGDSPRAAELRETLRQNAITFREPTGPLNGLLYSWLPQLIFAPRVIQDSAQTQFHNFLSLFATLISFLLCWLMFGHGAGIGWIGLAYGAFALIQIMRPMTRHARPTTGSIAETANVGTGSLVVLIVLAVVGPVFLGLFAPHLPRLGDLSVNGVVFVSFVCALAGCAAFGLSLKNQLQATPQAVGAARVTETVTMNSHPNKLVEELDRILMGRWYNNIPNRRYTRRSPVIEGRQGQFAAELFEESQPRPHPNRTASGIAHALASPQFFWLTCLTGLAMLFVAAGTIAAVLAARDIIDADAVSTTVAFALSQFALGVFCYRAAHVLWGRFDFVSELIWVDIGGSFESANVHIGNQLSGTVQTTKNVINIEAMTMRVWVSEIDTVIFGKDAMRQLIGMRGLPNVANELAASLKSFGEDRSMVVAPTSRHDMERARKIGAMGQLVAEPSRQAVTDKASNPPADGETVAIGRNQALAQASPAGRHFCTACGTGVDADSTFCSDCGSPVRR